MTTVHLVYPHGPSVAAPDAIGRNIGLLLSEDYDVRHYGWADTVVIRPMPGDILVGHPHPAPWTVFRRSMRDPGWRRVIAICPFNGGDLRQVAFLDPVLRRSDLYLAITGRHWFDRVSESGVAHWLPKMRHVDLAVDRSHFPRLKLSFNPAGSRRFVYIGNDRWFKNIQYLDQIAGAVESEFTWIGTGRYTPTALKRVPRLDFATEEGKEAVRRADFLITVGFADANPTTILEAMAWGLVPVCTRESGYEGYTGIVNVPLDDVAGAASVVEHLQTVDELELHERVAANDELLKHHFTWERFVEQVRSAIESNESPPLAQSSAMTTVRLRVTAVRSPFYWARPSNLIRLFGALAKSRMRELRNGRLSRVASGPTGR